MIRMMKGPRFWLALLIAGNLAVFTQPVLAGGGGGSGLCDVRPETDPCRCEPFPEQGGCSAFNVGNMECEEDSDCQN